MKDKKVGVVIPCYKLEVNSSSETFFSFINYRPNYHLCFLDDFVNTDVRLILEQFNLNMSPNVSVFKPHVKGERKLEVLRQAILSLSDNQELNLDYIGFLDSDLSTNLYNFEELVEVMEMSNYKIVSGDMVTEVTPVSYSKTSHTFSIILDYFQRIFSKEDKTTEQYGIKVIHRDVISELFREKFTSTRVFEATLHSRLEKYYGRRIHQMIYEKSLEENQSYGYAATIKDTFRRKASMFNIT